MKKHRNSQKRIYFEDACYFITSKTKENYPFFKETIFCDLFIEELRLCKKLKGFLLFGWVLCYDHFHWQIQPGDEFNYSQIMKSLKENTSYLINQIIQPEGATLTSRLLRLNQYFDANRYRSKFLQKYPNGHNFPKFEWQKSFFDHYIRNDRDFDYHLEYMEYNVDKHGLSENWSYIFTNPQYEDLLDDF